MTELIPKRASASRLSGGWSEGDYDMLADGAVVGRIFKAAASPVAQLDVDAGPMATPRQGYEATRKALMAAFAKSWRRE
jgi:hypothetical protein